MSYRLDPHEFRAWLSCLPLRVPLAFARDRERCPLAVHLSAEMGEPALVDADCWRLARDPDKVQLLPAWAEAFVRQVDALHPFPLTPAIALRILDRIEADSPEARRRRLDALGALEKIAGDPRTSGR
jgi:hypothetical protein